ATEQRPLGTAGSVKNAQAALSDDTFFVVSGDALTDVDLTALLEFHRRSGALVTVGLKSVPDPLEYGIVICDGEGRVNRFLEKPTWGQVFSDTVNTGIYVMDPAVLDVVPAEAEVDWSADVFPRLLAAGEPVYGYSFEGYWEDVGTLEAYSRAHFDVMDHKVGIEVEGFEMGDGVWMGEGTEIDPAARVDGPAIIGDYCRVEAGAELRPYTVLGANVVVRADARLERAVVHDNAYLGQGVGLRGCVVGRSCDLRNGARCEEGVVVGDDTGAGRQQQQREGVEQVERRRLPDEAHRQRHAVAEPAEHRNGGGEQDVAARDGHRQPDRDDAPHRQRHDRREDVEPVG
ncbi:MAG TPA: NDP-sugar synthase, partial [Mycobacteriales bacterium]|nr:NDP-sugar synthase [Mycobacteriales bacterium]